MKMAPAIAEQRQHRPHIGRDACYQLRQAVFARTIHFTEQVVLDRAKIVLEGIAA
jgi:hypothetical protein